MIREYYQSSLCDRDCEHAHRTSKAAERCASRRIRAGELRGLLSPEAAARAEADPDEPAMSVKRRTRSG
jgi:hypothetical protein